MRPLQLSISGVYVHQAIKYLATEMIALLGHDSDKFLNPIKLNAEFEPSVATSQLPRNPTVKQIPYFLCFKETDFVQ